MCELCEGTHVDKGGSGSLMFVQPCPECGPKPKQVRDKEKAEFRKRFEEAKRLYGKDAS